MKALTEDELKEYPSGQRVFVIIDSADPDNYLVFPLTLTNEMGVVAFLEQRDAEHMARLIKDRAKNFANTDLEIKHDLLTDLGQGSVKHKIPLAVLDEENAMTYFTRFPDSLDGYYGY